MNYFKLDVEVRFKLISNYLYFKEIIARHSFKNVVCMFKV